ncbi:hypothetical protein DH2020_035334 [Rehmannia glutinosa]|uniref:Uncharacterized protein n=1 Tax=Rehmannia glutinosa TaxID=99300 RepID=A0ABR0V9C8_REHGL
MEVIIPSQNQDFEINGPRSSAHVSGAPSPKRFGEYYFSAPTSPSHLSEIFNGFDDIFVAGDEINGGLISTVPFDWEEKPGTPKSPVRSNNGDDFAFYVSRDLETAPLSAEELFDGGTKKLIQGAFTSPRQSKSRETDPFAVAARNATKTASFGQRGRETGVNPSKSSSRKAARSLSPLRGNQQFRWEEVEEDSSSPSPSHSTVCSALSASAKGQRKWRLKDFFLFRSASEGRAAEKDPLKKYTAAIERPGSGSGSRRRGPVSAHEMHYTVNRAVSEDMKKKTFLPYKQGILGRLAFNPAVHSSPTALVFLEHKNNRTLNLKAKEDIIDSYQCQVVETRQKANTRLQHTENTDNLNIYAGSFSN